MTKKSKDIITNLTHLEIIRDINLTHYIFVGPVVCLTNKLLRYLVTPPDTVDRGCSVIMV